MAGPGRPQYGEFWESESGWVLLDCGDGGYLPVNQLTSMARLICDDSEAERVVSAMRRAGCPIVDTTTPGELDA
jgi:hypothetical protein